MVQLTITPLTEIEKTNLAADPRLRHYAILGEHFTRKQIGQLEFWRWYYQEAAGQRELPYASHTNTELEATLIGTWADLTWSPPKA